MIIREVGKLGGTEVLGFYCLLGFAQNVVDVNLSYFVRDHSF